MRSSPDFRAISVISRIQPKTESTYMYASLALSALLFVILGFLKIVEMRASACEAGTYHAPLSSPEEWSASLDVALGLDMWSTTVEEAIDAAWDMVPMAHAWHMSYTAPCTTVAPVRADHMLTALVASLVPSK